MMGLKVHIVGSISPFRLKTLCGVDGIPLTTQHTFVTDPYSEHVGRKPGTAGGGIRAISGLGLRPDHRACKRCTDRYAEGEG